MSYNHEQLFDKAVEVAKEYARSGGNFSVEIMLEKVYAKMVEIATKDGFFSN